MAYGPRSQMPMDAPPVASQFGAFARPSAGVAQPSMPMQGGGGLMALLAQILRGGRGGGASGSMSDAGRMTFGANGAPVLILPPASMPAATVAKAKKKDPAWKTRGQSGPKCGPAG